MLNHKIFETFKLYLKYIRVTNEKFKLNPDVNML